MRTSKYAPLKKALQARRESRIPMTFAEIEEILGRPLPKSARTHRAWWSNNPSNNVMTHAWLQAGYRTTQVDLAGERLVFERVSAPPAEAPSSAAPSGPLADAAPLYGMLRGSLTLPEATDLTAPASPEWAEEALEAAEAPLRQRQPAEEGC